MLLSYFEKKVKGLKGEKYIMTRKDVIQEMTARTNEKYNEMLEAEGKPADKDKFHRRDVTAFFAALEELVTRCPFQD